MTSPLISAAETHDLLEAGRAVVLDIRYAGPGSTGGREQYLAGHIPSAVFVDMDSALAAPATGPGGRHPLPEPAIFEAAMRAAGVSGGHTVVLYDDWKSIAAARAWWLLRFHGHRDVRVLDGGWQAWREAGLPTEQGEVTAVPGDFSCSAGDLRAVTADGAAQIAAEGVLLDARPANRFRGEDETVDPVAGHIPGARSLPAVDLVDAQGRFLPAGDLLQRFQQVEATEGTVGVYCGSGIQAAHAALAATVAGLPTPVLYPGSWSDWITDPSRAVELGE
ncbi:MAG: sulfurtransferase [Propionibacteriaceae bacterium]|nr:sulfurtransferase [Propionibacteriaceae bacterium]